MVPTVDTESATCGWLRATSTFLPSFTKVTEPLLIPLVAALRTCSTALPL